MKIKALSQNYEHAKLENNIFKFWSENRIYEKIKGKNKNRAKFYFLDGPPYVTNPIHVGTAWNKIIKDSYIRYFRSKGYDVWDIPGYDMHGLPIEVQVEKSLKIETKKDLEKFGVERFIKECKNFTLQNLKIQEKQFKELGIFMDWDNPYMTINNEYIEGVWYFLKKAYEKGLIFKGEKVVHWCPRCETVLAGYEVTEEYKDREDPSIYVKFKLVEEDASILIWTTTPWTLPSNVAVAIHPKETYVYVRDENGEVLILAKKRLEDVEKETKKRLEVIKEVQGHELKEKLYKNPLGKLIEIQEKIEHRIILSEEYVTMVEGTGCVHIAPGHGMEDFNLGKLYNLPALSPVDSSGRFTKEIPRYAGEYVFNANGKIIEDLNNLGALFYAGKITHRYPHCWRCKTPLILRLSDQWFLDVPKIKDKLIEEAKKINWIPQGSLENRVIPWLANAHEWALSRQRYWGIPLPIWICKNCGQIHVIGSVQELLSEAVIIPSSEIDLHKPWVDGVKIKCKKCGGIAERSPDVLDVWVDSGAASWASLKYPNKTELFDKLFPADLIIEGEDQIRGWFYSLLVTGVVTLGRAPMRNVLIHGWSLDEMGRAMHKSLGNVINPEDVIPKFGRDVLRVYELSNTTWEDLKFSLTKLQEYYRMMNIIWNTFYFCSLYMSIDRFDPSNFKHHDRLELEDIWLFNKLEEVKMIVEDSFLKFRNFEALRALLNFITEDVSRWYIKLIRRRVWIEKEDPSKEAAYYTLYKCLKDWLIMFTPFAPFITEAIYQSIFREIEGAESVHLLSWPQRTEVNEEILRDMEIVREIVSKANSLRMKKGFKLRRPVNKIILVPKEENYKKTIEKFQRLLKDQLNTKEIEILENKEKLEEIKQYRVKINYEIAGPLLRGNIKELVKYLENTDINKLKKELDQKGEKIAKLESGEILIKKEMLIFDEILKEKFASIYSTYCEIYIDFTMTQEMLSESLAKEIVRRIQMMRKLANLEVVDKINVYIKSPREEIELLKEKIEYIKTETQAKKIELTDEIKGSLIKEWEIDEETYWIGIEKV